MTLARKALLLFLALLVVLATAIYWVIGSESGTRFLLARAPLPDSLTLDGVGGSLLSGIEARSIEWRSADVDLVVRDTEIDIALRRLLSGTVWIRSLTVAAIDLRVRPTERDEASSAGVEFESPVDVTLESATLRDLSLQFGEAVRKLDELRIAGALRGSELSGLVLAVRSSWLDADLNGSAGLGSDLRANVELDWNWKDAAFGTLGGRLAVQGTRERYSVKHVLQAPVELNTSGHVSYIDDAIGIDLDNSWQALEWPLGDSVLQSAEGNLRLTGSPAELSFELSTDAALEGKPHARILATGTVGTDGTRVNKLVVDSEAGRLAASGSATWSPQLEIDVEFELADIDPSLAYGSLAGNVGGTGTVRGHTQSDQFHVAVDIASLGGELNGHELGGGGVISYDGEALQFERGVVRVGTNALRIEGRAGDIVALTANADFVDFGALLPGSSGAVTVAVDIRGSRNNPAIQFNASGNDVNWSGFATERLELTLDGTLDKHAIRAELAAAGGNARFEARGGLQQREWSGDITRLAVAQEFAGDWQLREASRLAVSPERAILGQLCLQRVAEQGQACAKLDAAFGETVEFDIAITRLPIAAIPVVLPEGVRTTGFADATAVGTYANQRVSAGLAVSLQDGRIDAVVDDEPIAAIFQRAEGRATIVDNALVAELNIDLADDLGMSSLQLSARDILDAGSAIDGEGIVAIDDLALLGIFVPDMANPRGVFRGRMAIGGTLTEPEFTGDLAITDAAFEVRRAGIEVRDVNIRLAQSAPGQLRFDGRAVSGEGFLTVEGDTWVSSATGIRSEVRLQGENFELLRLPDWRATASPDIVATFDDRVTRISGELVVPFADIVARDVPQSAVSASPDVVVHRADVVEMDTRRRIEVDVRAALGDNVKVAAFGLSTGITGAVQLRGGTHEVFSGFGRLTLVGGRYKAYGQDLDIERGELSFNGPLDNPQLDVRAIRRTPDVIAGIQLSGTPTQLRSSVFSEPALSEAEALSYLLTGRPLASASDSGDGDMLNAAAFALGVSSAGSIVSEIRAGLGLETLAIEGGADDSRLIAGKRFGNRLLVEYGYGLVDNLGTLLLRYQLSDRITLESRTGTVSNFDIVYSVKKQ